VPIRGASRISDEFSYDSTEEQDEQKLDFVLTPFGDHLVDDLWSPLKMYDLQVMHLRGPIADDPQLPDRLDKIDGLAVFHPIDRYMYIIAPGRLYTSTEVKQNVEAALLNKSDFTNPLDGAKKKLRETHKGTIRTEGMNLFSVLYRNGTELHVNKKESDSNFESELKAAIESGAVLLAIKNEKELK